MRATPSHISSLEEAQAVKGDGDGGAHVGEHGEPQRYQAEGSEQDEEALYEDRRGDVLSDDLLGRALSRPAASSAAPPLIKMPRREAAPMPETTVTGVEITSEHGQAMMSRASAL